MSNLGAHASASALDCAIGDLALITFYYLLRIGEYTSKGSRNITKQTVQFKFEDVTFFKRNRLGKTFDASRKLLLITSSPPPTEQPSSLTTNKMGGKERVCFRKQMDRSPTCALPKHSQGVQYI
jgi:hypothetical protein